MENTKSRDKAIKLVSDLKEFVEKKVVQTNKIELFSEIIWSVFLESVEPDIKAAEEAINEVVDLITKETEKSKIKDGESEADYICKIGLKASATLALNRIFSKIKN